MEKVTLLGNDFVINENNCNLSCQYCLTGQSNLKKSHEEQLIFKNPKSEKYSADSILKNDIDVVEQKLKNEFKFLMIKLTGGEIFLIKNFVDFINKIANKYEVVILQTNGILIKENALNNLEALNNIVVQ